MGSVRRRCHIKNVTHGQRRVRRSLMLSRYNPNRLCGVGQGGRIWPFSGWVMIVNGGELERNFLKRTIGCTRGIYTVACLDWRLCPQPLYRAVVCAEFIPRSTHDGSWKGTLHCAGLDSQSCADHVYDCGFLLGYHDDHRQLWGRKAGSACLDAGFYLLL